MRNYKAKDVDSYIASSPEEAHRKLKEIWKVKSTYGHEIATGVVHRVPEDLKQTLTSVPAVKAA